MSSTGLALVAPSQAQPGTKPIYNLSEFLLVGGATLLLLPLFIGARYLAGLDSSELVVGFLAFHAAYVINDPHFCVTYLLFYKDAKRRAFGPEYAWAQRLRYLSAGVLVPLALAAWAAWAILVGSAEALGLMMQLMFFLVGWHYVKQGFGVLTVLSARRGVRFTKSERLLVLGHCFCAWLYARMSPFDPGTQFEEKGVVYTSLPHPAGAETVTLALFGLSSLGMAWALATKWRRERHLPALPIVCFLVTVWVWVVYSSIDPLLVYVIPALHSVQYLYFVWLLKSNEARAQQGPPLFRRSVATRLTILAGSSVTLAWLVFHGIPELLDDVVRLFKPELSPLGPTPYLAAFVTFVNLHHYFMDNVIWRRENPETRFLGTDVLASGRSTRATLATRTPGGLSLG